MNQSQGSGILPPVLLILFAASGCSGLIYEIVWFQLLQLAIGSTSVSMGVLLATFMGGLCIGSVGPVAPAAGGRHPLRVYAALEVGIAICGIAVLFGMPYIDRVYVAGAEHGLPGMLLRGFICRRMPAAADNPDGRVAAGHIARWHSSRPRGERPGGVCCTAAIWPERCSAVCSRASTCSGFTTWPRARLSPRRSTWP